MTEARMIVGVLGIAVRAPHGLAPPPQIIPKLALQAAYGCILRTVTVKGKFIILMCVISGNGITESSLMFNVAREESIVCQYFRCLNH